MTRIGLLGGTFDPIHIGHLILAETAREGLALDQVVFVPAADPPHKPGQVVARAEDRLGMLDLALKANPSFLASLVDIERPGPHFTADMIELMRARVGPEAELWFLMGLDSLIDFPNWHQPDRIRRLCRLAAATRPGYVIDWAPLEAALPGLIHEVVLLPMPGLGISSHDLRARVQQSRSIRYQVPDPVRVYIEERGLYRETGRPVNQ